VRGVFDLAARLVLAGCLRGASVAYLTPMF
jgi:hypothetical protein